MRLARFASVGLCTLGIKMGALAILREAAGANYLVAIALATEVAVLHGFVGHQIWTWRDRRAGMTLGRVLARFARYNLLNGALAIAVNVLAMGALMGSFGLHYLPAGLLATFTAGAVNYFVSDKLIFVLRIDTFPTPAIESER